MITLLLLPFVWLFIVGFKDYPEYFKNSDLYLSSQKWVIVLAVLIASPLFVLIGADHYRLSIKKLWALRKVKKKIKRTLARMAKHHRSNPELEKDLNDLDGKF